MLWPLYSKKNLAIPEPPEFGPKDSIKKNPGETAQPSHPDNTVFLNFI
jgi:hypothetical protein